MQTAMSTDLTSIAEQRHPCVCDCLMLTWCLPCFIVERLPGVCNAGLRQVNFCHGSWTTLHTFTFCVFGTHQGSQQTITR